MLNEELSLDDRLEILSVSGFNAIEQISAEEIKLLPPKVRATAKLLSNIQRVDLTATCTELGWTGEETQSPKEKHYRVAIVHILIEASKKHGWHVIQNLGYFYIYTGAYWVALEDAEVKQLVKNAAVKMGYPEIECRNSEFVERLFKQTVQDGFFTERKYSKQSIINLQNGSLVLSDTDVHLKPFDHRDFLTHQLDFEHNATGDHNALFIQFLVEVLPDADTRKTLQQVAGYLFIKGLKMEKIFFLFGLGSNGKSVFFEVLSGVMGKENIGNFSLESLTDANGYFRAMIKDKIVNYGTDINLSKIDAGMFKTLASGEPIEARLPYKEPFIMDDYAKLIFNVNRMDSANIEHTHGFYRRLLIVPFNKTIADHEQDRDLPKKILEDKAGVLNWIIDGAREVIKNRDIFISKECADFKAQILKESDSVAMFEEQVIIESKVVRYSETVANAYLSYKEFCSEAGHKPLGRNNFSKRMEKIGFVKPPAKNTGIYLEKDYSNPYRGLDDSLEDFSDF